MAGAVVVGNLALLLDGSSLRSAVLPERGRSWHPPGPAPEMAMGRARRDPPATPTPTPLVPMAGHGWDGGGGEAGRMAQHRRKGPGPKVGAFSSESDGGAGGGEEDGDDWEKELRSRLKELEEMKELERRAEELQRRVAEERSGEEAPETEEERRQRVRRELEKLAKEQAEQREMAKLMFELGQKAYGKGMYARAIEFLEAALTIIPRPTLFGGEIQIWLAMAYEANNRHRDCITLYQQLEKKHPNASIRRQAAELRYILQAPKLKISKDEMVTIPLIGSSYDWYAVSWSDKYKNRNQKKKTTTMNQVPPSGDSLGDFFAWRPPTGLGKNRAFWVAVTLWLCLVGAALLLQR